MESQCLSDMGDSWDWWWWWLSVASVRFVQSDSHMISVGAEDRCVFQWKFEEDDEIDDADVINESESEGFKADMKDGSDLDRPALHDRGVDEFEDLLEREWAGLGSPGVEEGDGTDPLSHALPPPVSSRC